MILLIPFILVVCSFGKQEIKDAQPQETKQEKSKETNRIQWYDYNEGMELAKTQKKDILINFYAKWCGYCRKMEKDTFSNRLVANYLQDNYIPILINSDKERRLSASYGVRGLPFFWFLSFNGERITGLPGYVDADMFINYLKFIHTRSYNTMSFRDFIKKNLK